MRVLDGIRKRPFLQKMVFSSSSSRGSANTVTVIFLTAASNRGLLGHDAALIADGSVIGVPVPKAVIIGNGNVFSSVFW